VYQLEETGSAFAGEGNF